VVAGVENGQVLLRTEILDEEKCLSFMQTTLYKLRDKGSTVLVGRGGQALFREECDALHIRIVAPMEKRIESLMMKRQMTREEAEKFIQDRDRAAAQYIRRFYGVDWDDPFLYHLVLNTGLWEMEDAARIITHAARVRFGG